MFKYIDNKRCVWIEPFVGGANFIDKVPNGVFGRFGYDNNFYLIAMFNAIQNGWQPPVNISEDEYKDIKNNKEKYPNELVGFVGIACSFAGKWFGGYARGGTRNYCDESRRNLLRQKSKIQDVCFAYGDYSLFNIETPQRTVIYCDPPYKNTTRYHSDFNHDAFWKWADDRVDDGCLVFVSEYQAPDNWKCIWQKEIISGLDLNTGGKKAIEKLFIKNSQSAK